MTAPTPTPQEALDVIVRALKFELGDNLHRPPWKGWIANAESALASARPQPTENDVEAARRRDAATILANELAKHIETEEMYGDIDTYINDAGIDVLEDALAQARGKDTERLDWLEEAGANVSFYRDPLMDGLRWTVSWVDYKTHRAKGKILREAIDAAIAAQKEEVSGE